MIRLVRHLYSKFMSLPGFESLGIGELGVLHNLYEVLGVGCYVIPVIFVISHPIYYVMPLLNNNARV